MGVGVGQGVCLGTLYLTLHTYVLPGHVLVMCQI